MNQNTSARAGTPEKASGILLRVGVTSHSLASEYESKEAHFVEAEG